MFICEGSESEPEHLPAAEPDLQLCKTCPCTPLCPTLPHYAPLRSTHNCCSRAEAWPLALWGRKWFFWNSLSPAPNSLPQSALLTWVRTEPGVTLSGVLSLPPAVNLEFGVNDTRGEGYGPSTWGPIG